MTLNKEVETDADVEDGKLEKVQRLHTAHRKTKEFLENEPPTWELHPGTDIARNWTVITAAYSGLEQTIKYLVAQENGLHIAELLEVRENGKNPYRTHDVSELFTKLEKPTQEAIGEFYARFQSLHSYIAIETADAFLRAVSHPQGDGYGRWRYALIEERNLPRNSPEGLVKIWEVCVQIAQDRAWGRQRLRMPDEELTSTFAMTLDDMLLNVSVERQNAGEPFQETTHEAIRWGWSAGHPLNAFADVLWHVARYGQHGQSDVSDWLSEGLTRWANEVLKHPASTGRTSLRAFIARAQGHEPQGQSIQWNPKSKRFETVPWGLQKLDQEAPPANAIAISDPSPGKIQLSSLWHATKNSGYTLFENRSFTGELNQPPWVRTHEVHAGSGDEERPILTIWRKRDEDEDAYHMVEGQAPDTTAKPLREWMRLARTVMEVRAGITFSWVPMPESEGR